MSEPQSSKLDRSTSESEPLAQRAVKSFGWATVSYGGSKLVVFISTVVLARILTPNDFGIVAAATALILFFDVALDLGVGAALIYEQEHGVTARVQTAFTLNTIIATALTGIGVLITPAVAGFTGLQRHEDVFRVLFLYLLVRGLGQVQNAVLQRDLRFDSRAVVEIGRSIARASISIALALAGLGVWALVWGLLAGEIVGTVLAWWYVRFWPRFSFDRRMAKALLGFGLTFIALKVVDAIGMDSDYLVVAHRLGATQLGFYSMGYRLPELALLSLYWIVGAVAFPIFSQARTRGREVMVGAALRSLRMITLFSFPAGVLLALSSRDVVGVVFTAKWAPAVGPMVLISLMTAISSIGFASGDIFPAMGRPGTLLALNIPLTVLLVAGYILAAPHGIVAVAVVHLVLAVVYQGARLVLVNSLLGTTMRQDFGAMWPGFCALVGVIALAGPVRLFVAPGLLCLSLLLLAGIVGGATGLTIGSRKTLPELQGLIASLRSAGTA
ncbi:MAG TPA: lipopolysaccharide biosynthesis protein [Solirubrobacteraceae bacterium]|nr:lipopolysaccharide biosynthesis protein [Solirubrobacteraceae bacterium]